MMDNTRFWSAFFTGFLALCVCFVSCEPSNKQVSQAEKLLEQEIGNSLDSLVRVWYPRVIDSSNGGYLSDFNYAWEPAGPQNKMIVSQARNIWSAATLAMFYGDTAYTAMAEHGYRFIRDKMWDTIHGGFYTQIGRFGDTFRLMTKTKSSYGNAFAIYGLAAYYKASQDSSALALAARTFGWLEEHAHDPEYGGYFDVLKQDGSWLLGWMTTRPDMKILTARIGKTRIPLSICSRHLPPCMRFGPTAFCGNGWRKCSFLPGIPLPPIKAI